MLIWRVLFIYLFFLRFLDVLPIYVFHFTVIARNRIDTSIRLNMLMRFHVKLWIVLEDKVTVLIPRLFKLFSIKLVGELLGKMCLWENLILKGVLMEVWDHFLLWILRALDFTNCIKGLGYRRFKKEFSRYLPDIGNFDDWKKKGILLSFSYKLN